MRITTVQATLLYPKNQSEIWRDFGAGFCHKFNLDKSTCFKVISQVSLVDAKAWSAIEKNHSVFVFSEFAD
jgi:hypothetical protein